MARPKKILTIDEQKKLEEKIFVRETIRRILSHVEPRKIDYLVDTAILKSWLKKYSDKEFWNWFCFPSFLKDSTNLRPLTGEWGKEFLRKEYNIYLTIQKSKKENLVLSEKLGDDIQITTNKKQTLKEFLF